MASWLRGVTGYAMSSFGFCFRSSVHGVGLQGVGQVWHREAPQVWHREASREERLGRVQHMTLGAAELAGRRRVDPGPH
jgi:hypothetical protein